MNKVNLVAALLLTFFTFGHPGSVGLAESSQAAAADDVPQLKIGGGSLLHWNFRPTI